MNTQIDSQTIEHDGFTVHIQVVPDSDSTPFDADCYSTEDIRAWKRDEWFYVGYVYTASRAGVELGAAFIGGIEWDFPGTDSSIQAWIDENYYHTDLLEECITDAKRTLAALVAS